MDSFYDPTVVTTLRGVFALVVPEAHQRVAEAFLLRLELPHLAGEVVVRHDRRNGGSEAYQRRTERLRNARGHGAEVTAAAPGGDAYEGVHDTEHRPEQAQQWTGRPDGREPGHIARGIVPFGGDFLAKHQLQRLELGRGERSLVVTLLQDDAGLELLVKAQSFPKQPIVGRGRELDDTSIGLLKMLRTAQLVHESGGLRSESPELHAFNQNEKPRSQRKSQRDGEHHLSIGG